MAQPDLRVFSISNFGAEKSQSVITEGLTKQKRPTIWGPVSAHSFKPSLFHHIRCLSATYTIAVDAEQQSRDYNGAKASQTHNHSDVVLTVER